MSGKRLHPSVLSPLLTNACRQEAADSVNGISGSVHNSSTSEHECYRVFKTALLLGRVVITNIVIHA